MVVLVAALLIPEPVPAGVTAQGGGHARTAASATFSDPHTGSSTQIDRTTYEGFAELRLISRVRSDRLALETHYQLDTRFGELVRNGQAGASGSAVADDARDSPRLMDLSREFVHREHGRMIHRLDRLNLSFYAEHASVCIGRQALTWGNGFIFNPMDLFAPFSPTAVITDYKAGQDMALVQYQGQAVTDLQLLYVPRRDTAGGHVHWDCSSLAAKARLGLASTEADLVAGVHYGDIVVGAGLSGSWGGAGWRTDVTYTFVDSGPGSCADYASAVANLDTAWTWAKRNWYGLVEAYYSGIGERRAAEGALKPALLEKIARAELFTLGRYYLAGQLRLEYNPLVNLQATEIVNLHDGSMVFEPQICWDVFEDTRLLCGACVYAGSNDTEYGGFEVPPASALSGLGISPADRVYVWVTRYF